MLYLLTHGLNTWLKASTWWLSSASSYKLTTIRECSRYTFNSSCQENQTIFRNWL